MSTNEHANSSSTSPTSTASPLHGSPSWRPPAQRGTKRPQPTFERISTIMERLEAKIKTRTGEPALPFGIPALDRLTHGLIKGKITVMAARSSQGKTTLAMQTAWHLADLGKTVAYLTLEDDREELVERLLCHTVPWPNFKLRQGDVPVISKELRSVYARVKLLVLDEYGYNMPEIADTVHVLRPKVDVVVIDYAQMIDDDQWESEYRALSIFVRQVKMFAESEEIAVILASQINRQGAAEGRPSLHHLARCGRLEEVANLVLMLYWPAYSQDESFDRRFGRGECPHDYYELSVQKNKTGPKGTIPLRFIGEHYRFEPWPVAVEEAVGAAVEV